jgi:hypothetical protein
MTPLLCGKGGEGGQEGRREEEEEGEGVDIAPLHAPTRCRGKRASCSIAGVVKEAFNSRWVTWIRALKGLGIRFTDSHLLAPASRSATQASSQSPVADQRKAFLFNKKTIGAFHVDRPALRD